MLLLETAVAPLVYDQFLLLLQEVGDLRRLSRMSWRFALEEKREAVVVERVCVVRPCPYLQMQVWVRRAMTGGR